VSATDRATSIDEIADGIYRISTPAELSGGGGFTYNQYLIVDDEPLLFHTGLKRHFQQVSQAIERVMPVGRLRHLSFSHFEADECGGLNRFLAAAPGSEPLCGRLAAMVSINDFADRPARVLADGETVSLGRHQVRWIDAPHLPHSWECGFLFEETSRTLFCSDLFTQPGSEHKPLVESDILGPSEALRRRLDYYAHAENSRALFERVAATQPRILACMHGSAWSGDGAGLILALADAVERKR
jgi:flavorubredoxin